MSERFKVNDSLFVARFQPTEEDLRLLAADGFRAVVDLRQSADGDHALSPALEAAAAGRHGLRYVHIPVPTDRLDDTMLDRFRREIADLPGPILVQCTSGKRSGAFAIAHAAIEAGLSGRTALERIEDAGAAYGSAEMRTVLRRYVDRHGGPAREQAGLAPARRGAALGSALPATATRVEESTADAINRRIQRRIDENVRWYAAHPQEIGRRLDELDREWDMERTLETNAAALALGGVALGAFVDRRFLILPAAVTAFLMQHALQGWCPPVPFFRRRGVRTAAEIGRERYALKALRGDFAGIEAGDERHRAHLAVAAVRA